jgi:tetratricopeptide (TPR) repeat protein
MSVDPLKCDACDVDRQFDRAVRFPEQQDEREVTYAVTWRCPKCDSVGLDLCPLGPVEPKPGQCLNCGGEVSEAGTCRDCEMSADESVAFLRVEAPTDRALEDARLAFDEGLFRHAFAVLDVLLRDNPTVGDAWVEKARRYQSMRLNRAAIRCYHRALPLTEDPFVDISLACAHADVGENDEAIRIYDRVLSMPRPDDVLGIAHANRGNAHAVLGNAEAAVSDYEEAIRREPSRATHYLNYELLFARARRWTEAADVLTRGLIMVEGVAAVPLLVEKARIANEQELAEPGLFAADEALFLAPDHPRALYQRAWALGMLGRLEEARASLNRLLELEPKNESAQRALSKLDALNAPPPNPPKPWWKFWA